MPVIFQTLFSRAFPLRYSDTVTSHADAADFLEARLRAVAVAGAQINQEVELDVRTFAQHCHRRISSQLRNQTL
jgi:hypothetical protein